VKLVWRRRDRALRRRLVDGEDFSGAVLKHARLGQLDIPRARLRGANLSQADLRKVDLRWSDLRGARLKGTQLDGAMLDGANLTGADLRYATLFGAVFEGARLGGVRLRGAMWDQTTVWPKGFVPLEGPEGPSESSVQ
jgi:uncharacterized protein YjbI with pentapeptide repeats